MPSPKSKDVYYNDVDRSAWQLMKNHGEEAMRFAYHQLQMATDNGNEHMMHMWDDIAKAVHLFQLQQAGQVTLH